MRRTADSLSSSTSAACRSRTFSRSAFSCSRACALTSRSRSASRLAGSRSTRAASRSCATGSARRPWAGQGPGSEAADRWTWLVIAARTQLRLARSLAADLRRPWKKRTEQHRLTPARVRREFRNLRPRKRDPVIALRRILVRSTANAAGQRAARDNLSRRSGGPWPDPCGRLLPGPLGHLPGPGVRAELPGAWVVFVREGPART